jgi:hypothetical protein
MPRRPGPPKTIGPPEIGGEGPCTTDADCSVINGTRCCGCHTIEVRSSQHPRSIDTGCDCADEGSKQLYMPGGGQCGPMPPSSGDYNAICRKGSCVGIRK